MADVPAFAGFPEDCVKFLRDLAANNTREWFQAHKDDYARFVKEPAAAFVVALGGGLRKVAPGVHAEPAVNKSIFRVNRDVRFSADKSPYKTHLGVWLWDGEGRRMECSGFYFHLEPPRIMLGVGMYMFDKAALGKYRQAVVDAKAGPALARAAAAVAKAGYELGGEHYKRIPAGFDADHKNAHFLLHKGLYAGDDEPIPGELHTPAFVDYCLERYRAMLPLHKWLKK
jgi:uncharacterized protein (TIGR02453 family)